MSPTAADLELVLPHGGTADDPLALSYAMTVFHHKSEEWDDFWAVVRHSADLSTIDVAREALKDRFAPPSNLADFAATTREEAMAWATKKVEEQDNECMRFTDRVTFRKNYQDGTGGKANVAGLRGTKLSRGRYWFAGHLVGNYGYRYWEVEPCDLATGWKDYWRDGGRMGYAPIMAGETLRGAVDSLASSLSEDGSCTCVAQSQKAYDQQFAEPS